MAHTKPHLKRTIEEEKRTFQEHWEGKYLFADVNNVPECPVCQKTVSVPKEYNLRRHYEALHEGQYAEFTGKIREEKVMRLKLAATRQKDIFRKVNREGEVAVEASFSLSELIAKASKRFIEGHFIKNCLIRAAEIVCPTAKDSFEKISLSANTGARWVEDSGADLEMQLRDVSKDFCAHSLALDESTDINDIAPCVVFIRGATHDLDIYQELFDLLPLKGTTAGSDLWSAVKGSIEAASVKWENIASVAADGYPSMVDRNLGLIARLKETLAEEGVPRTFQQFIVSYIKRHCAAA
ncbi:general transcription factor II-I repeat domain-containing protein 2-like [Ornithodoros turicata]|uniref:general transcription factor II-I repeat domain-containing protein 2-like n=1 Tax=Ornithodoros turicata TaxID=34597 RepID=UPI003139ABB7